MKRLLLFVISLLQFGIMQSGMLQKSRSMMGPDSKQFADRQKVANKMVLDIGELTQEQFGQNFMTAVNERDFDYIVMLIDKGLLRNISKEHLGLSLLNAIMKKHERIALLLINTSEFDTIDKDYKTLCLIEAVRINSLQLVHALLNKKVDITHTIEQGVTPLFIAVQEGYIEIVKLLLDQFTNQQKKIAYITQASKEGLNSLFVAAGKGEKEILELLLKEFTEERQKIAYIRQAAYYGITPFFMAIHSGNSQIVELLLKQFTNQQQKIAYIHQLLDNEETPLFVASHAGNADTVKVLLDQFIDQQQKRMYINQATNKGVTPLFIAVVMGHAEVVKILLRNGADDSVTLDDQTLLEVARNRGYTNVFTILQTYKKAQKKAYDALSQSASLKFATAYRQFKQGNDQPLYDLIFKNNNPNNYKDIASSFGFQNLIALLWCLIKNDEDIKKAKKILDEVVKYANVSKHVSKDDKCMICLEEPGELPAELIPFGCCTGVMCTHCAIDDGGTILSDNCPICSKELITKLDPKYKDISTIQAALRQKKSQQLAQTKASAINSNVS